MTILEVIESKKVLETNIQDLLINFTQATKMKVILTTRTYASPLRAGSLNLNPANPTLKNIDYSAKAEVSIF